MLDSLRNIFNIPDLRKRIFYTFALLAVYRVGAHIPTPGVDGIALQEFFKSQAGTFLGFLDMFSGGALGKLTIFALGIMPYISASIILQLLTVVWPYLEELQKQGEIGRKKITQYTRYGTVVISIIQGLGISFWIESMQIGNASIALNPGWKFRFMTVLTLTTGTAFIMWLGEQITDRGIGNGISLIIFAGIVVRLPQAIFNTFRDLNTGKLNFLVIILLGVMMIAVIAFIVYVERGQRRIPVQYAKRVVGRKMYGGQSTHLPLKVNIAGVIPVIFAASIIMFPRTIAQFPRLKDMPFIIGMSEHMSPGMLVYNIVYISSIIFFCYFYASIIFNPVDVADNMKKYGGFIPGIRPGKKTSDFIRRVMNRITFGGALYLAAVSVLPDFLIGGFKFRGIPVLENLDAILPSIITDGLGLSFYFGGTSLLIVVGVAMDTMQQIESQLVMRHYDGFMKGSRMRGRR